MYDTRDEISSVGFEKDLKKCAKKGKEKEGRKEGRQERSCREEFKTTFQF